MQTMKKLLVPTLGLGLTICVQAQDPTIKNLQTEAGKTITKDPADTLPKTWKTGGLFSLNLAQGSLSNWAAGGDKFSISINTFLNVHAFYKKDKTSWDNNFDFNLGYVNTTSLGTRKNDDRFDLTSKYGYALNSKWNIGFLFDLRSQFFKGYSYPDATTKVYTSNFFAPAYILLSPGFDYHPVPNFSFFISPITGRWVIVKDTSLSALYGMPAGEKSDFQYGAYASVNYTANLGKSVTYKGRLDLFSNYQHKPQNVDLYMTNVFAAKISNVLAATYSLALIYDDDIRLFGPNHNAPRMQLQSLFGAGLLVKF
jgi:hypothetical protein